MRAGLLPARAGERRGFVATTGVGAEACRERRSIPSRRQAAKRRRRGLEHISSATVRNEVWPLLSMLPPVPRSGANAGLSLDRRGSERLGRAQNRGRDMLPRWRATLGGSDLRRPRPASEDRRQAGAADPKGFRRFCAISRPGLAPSEPGRRAPCCHWAATPPPQPLIAAPRPGMWGLSAADHTKITKISALGIKRTQFG